MKVQKSYNKKIKKNILSKMALIKVIWIFSNYHVPQAYQISTACRDLVKYQLKCEVKNA